MAIVIHHFFMHGQTIDEELTIFGVLRMRKEENGGRRRRF
jgi:hypothetical protein